MEISLKLLVLLPANPPHQAAFAGALSRSVLLTHLVSLAKARRSLTSKCLARAVSLGVSVFIRSVRQVGFAGYFTRIYFQQSWRLLLFNGKHPTKALYIDQHM